VAPVASSHQSREEQEVDGRGYSDFTRSNFHCGEYKQLCEVNGEDCDQVEHQDNTTSPPSSPSPSPAPGPSVDIDAKAGNLLFTYDNTNPEDLYCGFTFITDRFAVEAAHCWDNYQEDSFGDIRFKQLRDGTKFQEIITVKKVYQHPEYRAPILYNDIAVVELSRRVTYDYDQYGDSPTCLDRGDLQLEGRNVTSIGYGLTEHGTRGDLLAATMYVISNDECKQFYNYNITRDRNSSQFQQLQQALPFGFDYGLICTQGFQNEEGIFSGPCKGDSGSPLTTTNDSDRDTLVGIVSAGIGCGLGLPAWYTKVEFYYDWINCIVTKSQEFNSNKRKVEAACRNFVTRPPKDKEGCGLGRQGELFNLRSDPCDLS